MPPGKKAGGQPAHLWRLEWWGGQPPPKPGLTAGQIRELLILPPGVYTHSFSKEPPRDGSYLRLYVVPHGGALHWWFSQVTGTIRGKTRSRGDLPLVYATAKTGQDSLKASVGVMLIRQLITDKDSYKAIDKVSREAEIKRRGERLRKLKDDIRWVEEFIVWLYHWATKLVGEDNAWDSTYKFLLEYYPAIHSPKAYFLKSKPHQDKFSQKGKAIAGEEFTGERFVQQHSRHYNEDGEDEREESLLPVEKLSLIKKADSLGINRGSLYYHLQKLGHYKEVTSSITEGELTLKTTKKDYKLTEEAIAAIKEKVEQRRKRVELVKCVMKKLGMGKRAAQKRVQRWVEAGKTY